MVYDDTDLDFLEAPSVLYEWSQNLGKLFVTAQKSIKVFLGELHWMLYSHPSILSTLRERHANGVKIYFIAGPFFSASKRGMEKHLELLDLKDEGVIELYSRDKRGKHPHFIIIDDKKVLVELSPSFGTLA